MVHLKQLELEDNVGKLCACIPSVAIDLDHTAWWVSASLVSARTLVDGDTEQPLLRRDIFDVVVDVLFVGGREKCAGRALAARVAAVTVTRRRRDAVHVGTGAWTRRDTLRVEHR